MEVRPKRVSKVNKFKTWLKDLLISIVILAVFDVVVYYLFFHLH